MTTLTEFQSDALTYARDSLPLGQLGGYLVDCVGEHEDLDLKFQDRILGGVVLNLRHGHPVRRRSAENLTYPTLERAGDWKVHIKNSFTQLGYALRLLRVKEPADNPASYPRSGQVVGSGGACRRGGGTPDKGALVIDLEMALYDCPYRALGLLLAGDLEGEFNG